MSIWSTLYAITDDGGLEATGLRPVFDGMDDLPVSAPVPLYVLNESDEVVPLYVLNGSDEEVPLWVLP